MPKPEKAPKLDRLDVPDRLAVKDSSAQTSLEAKRREEMIERRKKCVRACGFSLTVLSSPPRLHRCGCVQ